MAPRLAASLAGVSNMETDERRRGATLSSCRLTFADESRDVSFSLSSFCR